MSWYIVDVEADGKIPPHFSIVSFGCVKLTPTLDETFYAELKPISEQWNPESLAVSGFTREQCLTFDDPSEKMSEFAKYIETTNKSGRPIFVSDNVCFDWQWINYYFHRFYGDNPFGWSGRRISDMWCGYKNDMYLRWKKLRKTKHTHNALDDAISNATALLEMKRQGLNIKLQ